MGQRSVRVMIVDDHAVVRSGLGIFLSAYDDLELAGEARSGPEGIIKCRELDPDVILMDLVMPAMDGVEATRLIREEHPNVQVIALTSYEDEELVDGALRAGAIGYLLKNVSADELASAIRAASVGRSTLAPEAAQVLIKAAIDPGSKDKGLSQRELELLGLMVGGLTNREIAKELFISVSTVKFHVSNILMKLGVSSRTEAVSMAIHEKLVK